MKFIIILLSFFVSQNAFANTACDSIQTEYKINAVIEPIKYIYNLKTYQIKQLANGHSSTVKGENTHTLGFLQSELAISNVPEYTIISQPFSNTLCSKTKRNILNIKMTPTIYIASDIIGIPCISNHTLVHEQTHYKFHSDAIRHIHQSYKILAQGYFGSTQYNNNQTTITNNLSKTNQLFVAQINKMYEDYVHPRDKYLDDPVNTEAQMKMCPFVQQQQLNQLLRSY